MPYKDPAKRRAKALERYYADTITNKARALEWRKANPEAWQSIQQRYNESRFRVQPVVPDFKKIILAQKSRDYRIEQFAKYTLSRVRRRAAELGVPFDVGPEDFNVPSKCPVLGIVLTFGGGQRDSAPSVDRIVPAKGYVKGNVRIISMKANRIKNDATVEELQLVLEDLRRLHGRSE